MALDLHSPRPEGRHRPARIDPRSEVAPVESVVDQDGPGSEDELEGPDRVRLLTVPVSVRGADVSVGTRAVRGVLLITVLAVLALGGRWWWVQQQATAVPIETEQAWSEPSAEQADSSPQVDTSSGGQGAERPAATSPAGLDPALSTAGGPEPTRPSAQGPAQGDGDGEVMVHVIGEVHEPGVVQLAAGSRVVDAVQAAGGLTDQADAGSVNLARSVLDGEQVWVGAPGQEPPAGVSAAAGIPGPAGASGAGGDTADVAGMAASPLLDLNTATQTQLESLPGVGPVTAERIVMWRSENGPFTDTAELLEVSGIGERRLATLEPLVQVGG